MSKIGDHTPPERPQGFTLIEILIVVVILGILAGVVIPTFGDFAGEAERAAFIQSGRQFVTAAHRYRLDYGIYPSAAAGVLPAGFGDYIRSQSWEAQTPVGGVWDADVGLYGVTASLGVRYTGPDVSDPRNDDVFMQEFDAIFDDGDLVTGAFRKMNGDLYQFVVAN